ncbi:hypothetical protein ABPG72_008548 [Tetrahymena utriculariae]
MSIEVIQQNLEIRDIQQMLVSISSADEDRQLLAFLAGAQYAYGKVERNLLRDFIAKIDQLLKASQQNGLIEIKQKIFASLINNTQQEPLTYVESLSQNINNQINSSKNSQLNQNQNDKSILDDENEEEQKEINDNINKLNQIECEVTEMQQINSLENNELINQNVKSIFEDENEEEEEEEQKERYENKWQLNQTQYEFNGMQLINHLKDNEINNQNNKFIYDDENVEEEEEQKEIYDSKGKLNQIQQNLKGIQYNDDYLNTNYLCKICYDQTDYEELIYLECDHILHQQCLNKYLNDQISKENIFLNCPHTSCFYQIPQIILKEILNKEQFEIYEKKSLSNFLNQNKIQFQMCPTKDCQYAFVNEDNLTLLDCPFCKKIYCLSCNCLYHEHFTCEEYQIALSFEQLNNQISDQDEKENLPFKSNQIQTEQISNKGNKESDSDKDKDEKLPISSNRIQTEQTSSDVKQISEPDDESDWNCEICYEKMTCKEYLPLYCDHIFHKSCLAQHFTLQVNEKKFPLNCPSSSCILPVQQQDLKEVLNKYEFEKYEKFCLQNYIDSNQDEISWCPTPNCEYAFILEDGQNILNCPKCKKPYCLNCKCDYHQGQTCQEYKISNNFTEDDQKFEQLVVGQKFKKCSKCKIWVEKNQGCDHMTCRCGYQFCYKCGGVYLNCDCPQQFRQFQFNQFNNNDEDEHQLFAYPPIRNNQLGFNQRPPNQRQNPFIHSSNINNINLDQQIQQNLPNQYANEDNLINKSNISGNLFSFQRSQIQLDRQSQISKNDNQNQQIQQNLPNQITNNQFNFLRPQNFQEHFDNSSLESQNQIIFSNNQSELIQLNQLDQQQSLANRDNNHQNSKKQKIKNRQNQNQRANNRKGNNNQSQFSQFHSNNNNLNLITNQNQIKNHYYQNFQQNRANNSFNQSFQNQKKQNFITFEEFIKNKNKNGKDQTV